MALGVEDGYTELGKAHTEGIFIQVSRQVDLMAILAGDLAIALRQFECLGELQLLAIGKYHMCGYGHVLEAIRTAIYGHAILDGLEFASVIEAIRNHLALDVHKINEGHPGGM